MPQLQVSRSGTATVRNILIGCPAKTENRARKHAQFKRISQLWGCTHGLEHDRRRGITTVAPMAELVDAPHSKCGSERSAGSIPAWGTISKTTLISLGFAPHAAVNSLMAYRRRQAHETLLTRSRTLPGFHLPDAADSIRRIPLHPREDRRLNFAITPAFLKARPGYLLLFEV